MTSSLPPTHHVSPPRTTRGQDLNFNTIRTTWDQGIEELIFPTQYLRVDLPKQGGRGGTITGFNCFRVQLSGP